ncbi:hydrogenase maturation protease [Mycobacterium ahvazicum]|nr:hydrogenase maturation protease [Mycobacterium ahvazicum]
MTGEVVVVGLGNILRKDDAVGIVAAVALKDLDLPGVCVVAGVAEPLSLLDAWSGARLAVVIDGTVSSPPTPGYIRRCSVGDVVDSCGALSSHTVDIGRTYALGKALGNRVPDELVVFTIDIAATDHGIGLTPQVARAIPDVIGMAVDEINRNWH